MDWKIRRLVGLLLVLPLVALLSGCSISYKFNGGSLDYTRIKSISIADVQNRAAIVYPTLAPDFTEELKTFYTRRTRLEQVARSADLELECTFTGYDLSPMAVREDNYASRTVLTVTLQVKYVNHVDEKESFDRSFKAFRDFDRDQPFVNVQDQLLEEIKEDLIKQIYNATVENW